MNRLITVMCVLFFVGASPVYAGHHRDYDHRYDRSYSRSYSHHHHHRRGSAAALGFLGGFVVGNMVSRPAPPPRRVVYVTPYYYQSPIEQVFDSQSSFVRRQLQARLQEMGFYYSYVDGVWGPATQSAFEDYASSSGQLHLLTSQSGADVIIRMLLSGRG